MRKVEKQNSGGGFLSSQTRRTGPITLNSRTDLVSKNRGWGTGTEGIAGKLGESKTWRGEVLGSEKYVP